MDERIQALEARIAQLEKELAAYSGLDELEKNESLNSEISEFFADRKNQKEDHANLISENQILKEINKISLELSSFPDDGDLFSYIAQRLKSDTNAVAVTLGVYDPVNKCLRIQKILSDSKLLSLAEKALNTPLSQIVTPIDERTYKLMTSEQIGIRHSLHDITFGAVPKPAAAIIKKILRIDRFMAICYMCDGKLFGTSVMAFEKDTPDPPTGFLIPFASVVAVSLKRILTEQKLKSFENEILQSEHKFRTLLESLNEGVVIVDQNQLFVYTNYSADKIFGVEEGMLIGKPIKNFIKEDQMQIINSEQDKRKQGLKNSYELIIQKKSGESRTVLVSASPLMDGLTGRYTGTLALVSDISERKSYEHKIIEQSESKDKLLSIIAHDLKNPFHGILGIASILKENLNQATLAKLPKLSESLYNAAEQAYRLLENLLAWTRSNMGKIGVKFQKIALRDFVEKSLMVLKPMASSKNINFRIEINPELMVFSDINMLDTILRNLVSNSIKYSYPGKNIIVSAEENSSEVIIIVEDEGIGITKELMAKLFKVEEKYSTEGTAGEKGTGLGLVLCKEFIEKLSGKLKVESSPGKGTKFTIILNKKNE